MNPAIHHPFWYGLAGIITEEEKEEAIKRPVVLMPSPFPLSQFDTGTFTIICNQGAWEIRTNLTEQRHRIGDIARVVFDETLKHTPVLRFGFNFQWELDIERHGVGKSLGLIALRTGLDFGALNPASSEIKVSESSGKATVSNLIKPGRSDTTLSVMTNVEYIMESKETTFFYIGEYIRSEYDSRYLESVRVGQSIAKSISNSE